jgi:hypothetical protein
MTPRKVRCHRTFKPSGAMRGIGLPLSCLTESGLYLAQSGPIRPVVSLNLVRLRRSWPRTVGLLAGHCGGTDQIE